MAMVRVILHSLALTLINIAAIIAGFFAYHVTGTSNQIAMQFPIATGLSILLFATWTPLAGRLSRGRLTPAGVREYAAIFIGSLLWNPLVWVPLHYVTQGYLTSVGNIVALLLFQLPVNALAILATWNYFFRRENRNVLGIGNNETLGRV